MALKRLLFVAMAVAVASCSSNSTGPHTPPPNIFFVAGNHQSDTINGTLSQQLILRVRIPNEQQSSGHLVQFQSLPDTNARLGYQLYLGPVVQGLYGGAPSWSDTTNAAAMASVTVTMGAQAGTARLVITVPDFGYVDTTTFTVLAGGAYAMSVSPADTTIYDSTSFTYNAMSVDRYGNPRHGDSLTYTVLFGPVTVVAGKVTTTGYGDATVTIAAPKLGVAVNATLRVVPHGTLAASVGGQIAVFNLNGSGMVTVTPAVPAAAIKWDPTGTHLVFDGRAICARAQLAAYLHTTDLKGATVTIDSNNYAGDQYPSYSRDGSWVYYSRNTGNWSWLWRVHPDGTSDDSLVTTMSDYNIFSSPSPDGSKLAYVADHTSSSDLRILTISTGAVTSYNVTSWSPEWSPTGNQIAYLAGVGCDGQMAVINADGSGQRTLTSALYYEDFDWSPDGQWVAASNESTHLIDLINVSTGNTISLPFTANFGSPSWKP